MPDRPIITLLSDFGVADAYVAEMKAALLVQCREATLVDITHAVPRHDVLAGAIALERAVSAFPPGTVHVAVVDPGVGTDRKLLAVRIRGQMIFAPDNGLVTWAVRRHGCEAMNELIWRPPRISSTFHGRDVLCPAAGLSAAGKLTSAQARPLDRVMLLDIKLAQTLADARVLAIDHFGNVITNVPGELVELGLRVLGKATVHRTFADVARRTAVAYVGSAGLLEIAVNHDSAAKKFRLRVGQKVRVK